jgi:hypothetical protein
LRASRTGAALAATLSRNAIPPRHTVNGARLARRRARGCWRFRLNGDNLNKIVFAKILSEFDFKFYCIRLFLYFGSS